MAQQYQVQLSEAKRFATVWKSPAGLIVNIGEIECKFATDFANVVLHNFILMCQQQAAAAIAAAQTQQAPAEPAKSSLILEGM